MMVHPGASTSGRFEKAKNRTAGDDARYGTFSVTLISLSIFLGELENCEVMKHIGT
jgi:hypothetical protein